MTYCSLQALDWTEGSPLCGLPLSHFDFISFFRVCLSHFDCAQGHAASKMTKNVRRKEMAAAEALH
jgi:hypothetical protein